MIKITSGINKNKSLETISKFVRPTSSLKREAFFSIIDSYSIKKSLSSIKGKVFLDLFAGIGTMGLEAISRGYKKAVFVENNNEVIKVLKRNCKNLCFNNQYTIIEQDVFRTNRKNGKKTSKGLLPFATFSFRKRKTTSGHCFCPTQKWLFESKSST